MIASERMARIQAAIRTDARRSRNVEQIGPFLATFTREDDNPFLNYALPDEGAIPSTMDVRALVSAYRERFRKPRLEYLPSLAPKVEPALLAEGFGIEGRLPLMTSVRSSLLSRAVVPGIELVAPASVTEFRDAASAQWEAYAERGEAPQRVVDGLRRTAEGGGGVVLARDATTHEPAGAGICTAPHRGFTELSSIGVRERFRRRGIAGAMAGWLGSEALERGVECVFLMADGAVSIYARVGFLLDGEVLHISRS